MDQRKIEREITRLERADGLLMRRTELSDGVGLARRIFSALERIDQLETRVNELEKTLGHT